MLKIRGIPLAFVVVILLLLPALGCSKEPNDSSKPDSTLENVEPTAETGGSKMGINPNSPIPTEPYPGYHKKTEERAVAVLGGVVKITWSR